MFTPGKILTLFALSGACCFGALWAQQLEEKPARIRSQAGDTPPADGPVVFGMRIPAGQEGVRGAAAPELLTTAQSWAGQTRAVTIAGGGPSSPASQSLKKAVKQYQETKEGSPEREKARGVVAESLGELYDEHLANQEKQIAELEERLAKLRDQVKRRREAKAKMVELKLEMVISQADGLGWPENSGTDWYSTSDQRYLAPGAIREMVIAPLSTSPAEPPKPR